MVRSSLTESLEDMIARTTLSYRAASRPEFGDIFLCMAPHEVGKMYALRADLKKANVDETSPFESELNLIDQSILDNRIRRKVLVCVLETYAAFMEGKNSRNLKVTQKGQIVYREPK